MRYEPPLSEMSQIEKLQAIELLWNDLINSSENIDSPDWHQDILSAREEKVRSGKAEFRSLDEVKKRISDKMK